MSKLLTQNLPIKLTSLALAVLLWTMVAGQREVVRQLKVPLALPVLPDSLMYMIEPPENVTVTFRASGRRLFWFRLQPPRIVPSIPLQAHGEPITVPLRQEFLDLPRQFSGSVLDIQPPFLRLQLALVLEKEIPVRPVLGKEPRHPYRLDETQGLQVEPPRVRAKGPADRVGQMPWVRTEFLDLLEETEGGERELALETGDSLIRFVPETVKVRYRIIEWQPD